MKQQKFAIRRRPLNSSYTHLDLKNKNCDIRLQLGFWTRFYVY